MSLTPLFFALVSLALPSGDALVPLVPVQDQDASELDTSGVDLFWETAGRLAAGEELTDSDWDAFFSHPGYAVTEASGQRRSVITHCMDAVFSPEGDLEMAKENLPAGEGRRGLVSRTCDHVATIAERRGDIERYLAELEGADFVEND